MQVIIISHYNEFNFWTISLNATYHTCRVGSIIWGMIYQKGIHNQQFLIKFNKSQHIPADKK